MAATTRPMRDKMDWLYINTSCFGVSDTIAKTSASITRFVREVRESRSDFDVISSELHSLDGIVDLLKDDVSFFPPELAQKTPAVLDTCFAILNELEGCISVLDRSSESRADKKSRWIASRDHIGKLQWTLEGYKSTLGLAVDLVALYRPRKTGSDEDQASPESEEGRKNETARLVHGIQDLASRLEPEARQNGAVARLQQYLEALYSHAVSANNGIHDELGHVQEQQHHSPPSINEAPDSAIEMNDDQLSPLPVKQPAVPPSPSVDTSSLHVDEVDEILDELRDMPQDPPVPPPRSARRPLVHAVSTSLDRPPSNSGSYTVSGDSGYRSFSSTTYPSPQSSWNRSVHHSRSWSLAPSETPDSIYEGYSTPATEISGDRSDRDSSSLERVRPDSETIGQPLDFSRFSKWENPRPNVPIPGAPIVRPSTSSSSATSQSGRLGGSLGRRSSSRLSMALKGLRIGGRRSSSNAPPENRVPLPPPQTWQLDPGFDPAIQLQPPQSLAVFGVPLAESMRVAKGLGHDAPSSSKEGRGNASQGNNTRSYPLCVLRCVYFIQEQGLEIPDIFGRDGNHLQLANLKEIFSSIDTGYGKLLDWNQFTAHEAAHLILHFLSELPTPLVPESVGKRWIFLSRQATVAGSMAMRLDQGIDFWEEAFLGIHGPSRALLRLLLNLWGDIADMSEFNNMTAERLAGRALRPVMHNTSSRLDTDLMLGLAFMIRKRSEYRMKAKGTGRKSNAAF